MKDQIMAVPLRVAVDEIVGPYIRLPYSQLEDIRRVLEGQNIRYTVQENIVSLSGGPFFVVVNLGRDADATAVQSILDQAG